VKRALAKFALVLFLSAVLSPCGLVPVHEEYGHAHSHQTGGDHHAAAKASVDVCGTDLAAPRAQSGATALCQPKPALDFASVTAPRMPMASPASAPIRSRAGPPPRPAFIQIQRLLL